MAWAERAAERSPLMSHTRSRSIQQTRDIVGAARRLIAVKGSSFTTQELVKEAGVAMQTFYRHFAGKDQLILAAIEDIVAEYTESYEQAARTLPDPMSRLRHHLMSVVAPLTSNPSLARFVTSEHWRLRERFPDEIAVADQPFVDLLERELREAQDMGLLPPNDPGRDAAMIAQIAMSVFHHYSFASNPWSPEALGNYLWEFCIGGITRSGVPRLNAMTSEVALGPDQGIPGESVKKRRSTTF